MAKEEIQSLEWRVKMPDGTSHPLQYSSSNSNSNSNSTAAAAAASACVKQRLLLLLPFFQNAWNIGVNEPKKVTHCLKVGLALSLVSLFYYMRPLYHGVGGNAMWAVMTVVVVFEYTVGATLSKSVNRATGTFLAGALGVGVHFIASQAGDKYEPLVLQTSVFILATAATFSRFIPSVKARFDYGAMIFILTFSLVSVSSYRVDKLFDMARQRLSTIVIGTSICIITSIIIRPVWAGSELHTLIKNNMDNLSHSLDGCVAEYFNDVLVVKENDVQTTQPTNKSLQGYKCALNSKATEESMANFARWEPAHGNFNFGHPWKEYLKVGASLRSCAYCIEAFNGSIRTDAKAPDYLKKHFSKFCISLSTDSSAILTELSASISSIKKSTKIDLMVDEMRNAVQELQNALKSLSKQPITESSGTKSRDSTSTNPNVVSLLEIVPLATVTSLLIEMAARTERVVEAVNGLADKADFKVESLEETRKRQSQKV